MAMLGSFYQKAGACTIFVIKHNGATFDYVNGSKNNFYFASWTNIRRLMDVGQYYAIAVSLQKGKLKPIGIFATLTEDEAHLLSKEHVDAVLSGQWDGDAELANLRLDCAEWLLNFFKL